MQDNRKINTSYQKDMQNGKTVTNITYSSPPQDGPLSDWRRRKYVGVTHGTFGSVYSVSAFNGVPSTVISKPANNFWIVTEEQRARSRKNLRLYNVQMLERYLLKVDVTEYRQSIRGTYHAMATDEDTLMVCHGSRPVKMDIWHQTFDQKTIKLVDVRFERFMPTFTDMDSLYAFNCNDSGILQRTTQKKEVACGGVAVPTGVLKNNDSMILVHKTLMAIKDNGTGGYDIWTLAIANQSWSKCTVEIDSENCIFTVNPSSVVHLCGRNKNTGECTFWTVDNMREELKEGVRTHRRMDAATNQSVQNAPLRKKISWKAMIRKAIKADPRKKATLRDIIVFRRQLLPPDAATVDFNDALKTFSSSN
ncbi:hypothetical protein L3Y34_010563 [Caenorhabditis briggsae]|uniref:Uncharacterized protein n=1 Tax=Caenorhabditis briggsae TaxID=6238 RepID=A0AAE9CST6_CAEBR|nr:hypothetical protein L3Y34_010563 [Caenorhabditis briggsae]